jgi:flagellar protein FlbB
MPPKKAVDNLLAMDDQDVIDILRNVEANAKKDGKTSSVSYWFSLMPPARAAEIQRKMSNKPATYP